MVKQFAVTVLSASDISLLLNVTEDVFDNPIDKTFAREFLNDPRHHIVAAIADGVVVGFASAVHYIHPDKPPELWVNEVAIAPSYQRQGLAKTILKDAATGKRTWV